MSKILLSIKPEYAHAILNGTKKFEYRKHIAQKAVNSIIIYSTLPEEKVIGEVEVLGTLSMKKTPLWEKTKSEAGISREKYREYFRESNTANAYILGKAFKYDVYKSLNDFGISQAPQSFVYLSECPFCGSVLTSGIKDHGLCPSKSEEHIIPLSLGNEELVLPPGTICDDCNNYFALNIEKDFLCNESILKMRSYHCVQSRKKKVPDLDVLFGNEKTKLEIDIKNHCCSIGLNYETIQLLKKGKIEHFFTDEISIDSLKNNYTVSRFLVKIFVEINLFYALKISNEHKVYSFDEKFRELITYVRRGDINKKIYKYDVIQNANINPFSGDDFIASITMNTNSQNVITGMTLKLYELEFVLII